MTTSECAFGRGRHHTMALKAAWIGLTRRNLIGMIHDPKVKLGGRLICGEKTEYEWLAAKG